MQAAAKKRQKGSKKEAKRAKKEVKKRQKGGAKMAKSWRNCKIIVGLASGNSFELLLTAK